MSVTRKRVGVSESGKRRIDIELRRLRKSMEEGYIVKKLERKNDYGILYVEIGFKSVYFRINIEFPTKYPDLSPVVRFVKDIPYHVNVMQNSGQFLHPILSEEWNSSVKIIDVLRKFVICWDKPSFSCFDSEVKKMYDDNRDKYKIKRWRSLGIIRIIKKDLKEESASSDSDSSCSSSEEDSSEEDSSEEEESSSSDYCSDSEEESEDFEL